MKRTFPNTLGGNEKNLKIDDVMQKSIKKLIKAI